MKKLMAIALTAAMSLGLLAGCGSSSSTASEAPASSAASSAVSETPASSAVSSVAEEAAASSTADAAESDLEYVKANGKLVVGITDFAPMDYKDESGNWIGFDAEVEFVEIDWDNKILELDGKTIDCVWNGMTLTDEVKSAMNCTGAYLNNAQIVVVPADKADQYQTEESLAELNFAVEAGSAGEAVATEKGLNATPVKAQADALMEVAAGTSDAAIIDSLMAAAMVGEGTGYETLTYTIGLSTEEYGVGFRKGSDLTDALNDFFKSAYADGSMQTIAETYGVQAALVEQQ